MILVRRLKQAEDDGPSVKNILYSTEICQSNY